MSRLPIRIRLTLAFAIVMALVLTAFGLIVYTSFEDSLDEAVDQSLRSRASDLEAVVARAGTRLPESRAGLVETEDSFAQVLGTGGELLQGTARVRDEPLLSAQEVARARASALSLARSEGPVERGDPVRLLAVPAVADGREVVLVVGQATDDNEESLGTLKLLLLAGLPVALALASLAGYGVAAAALRPVEAMRRKAAEIGDASTGERLPLPGTADELGRLGATLNAMLARLEQALDRERRFVADASHELRTPVAILKAELELALREGRTEEELRDALGSAFEETERITRLADDLLVLARTDSGTLPLRLERLSPADLMTDVARRFRAAGHRIEVDAPAQLALSGDRLRLEQALGNLVANALEHGEEPVRLWARSRGSAVELHVEDQGAGLPPAFAEQAFERFTRPDGARAAGGAGLGLAIVQAIAAAHDGKAAASGADVWIELPALIEDSSQLARTPA